MRLPPLRQELSLLPGPSLTDGQPSWTLHDPTRQLFYRIDWPTFEVLKRWSLGDSAAIAQDIKQNTLLAMSVQEVDQAVDFLLQTGPQLFGIRLSAKCTQLDTPFACNSGGFLGRFGRFRLRRFAVQIRNGAGKAGFDSLCRF